ncbi:proprotein convertase subtilisin/kexin type 5 [Cricetulus griseus]|nr:proprotein convertase subtilisin/kexin type 5 [Cricetulus griseus]
MSGYFIVPTNHTCQKLECGQGLRGIVIKPALRRPSVHNGNAEPVALTVATVTSMSAIGVRRASFSRMQQSKINLATLLVRAAMDLQFSALRVQQVHTYGCTPVFLPVPKALGSQSGVAAVRTVWRTVPLALEPTFAKGAKVSRTTLCSSMRAGATINAQKCMPNFFLYDDTCYESCPKHFYPDLHQCVPCHENCLECKGPKEDDCKACADTSKVLYKGLCLDMCPEGTYKDEADDECKDCFEFCRSCSSAWTCLACQEGLTIVNEVCKAPKECAAVEYWDEGTHRCQPCHRKCSRCSGPAEDQCYTCPGETLLLNTTCVKSCPEGYHTDKDSHRCVPCHSSCRTCEGSHSMQCHSCRPGWFQLGKECLLQCRDGYYGESGRCEKCDKSCKACRGPRPTDCQSCDKFFFLLRSKGQCHRTCPEHYFADQHAQTCERCHPTCDKCDGFSSISTLSLHSPLLQHPCCLPNFLSIKGEKFNCKKCHESCVECKGPGAKNCTVCPDGLLLHMDEGRCLHCCNASHPQRSQDCCDCQSTTEECILPVSETVPSERTKTALLVTSGAMLLLLLGAAVVVWRKSRSRPVAKGRYEKLAEPTVSYSSYRSSYLEEDQVIEYRDRDYDEDDEDDIVYMSQDGTVYRKFKYGLLEEAEDDELEYDDESYSFQ